MYGVSYFNKDSKGRLAQFDNKSPGFRIITKRNHYKMDFDPKEENAFRQFELLKKFYTAHVHPVLPMLVPEQFSTI